MTSGIPSFTETVDIVRILNFFTSLFPTVYKHLLSVFNMMAMPMGTAVEVILASLTPEAYIVIKSLLSKDLVPGPSTYTMWDFFMGSSWAQVPCIVMMFGVGFGLYLIITLIQWFLKAVPLL